MPAVDREPEATVLLTLKRYFYLGFAFLPWLWLYAFLYVFPILRRPELNKSIKHYAYAGLGLSFLFFVRIRSAEG